MRGAAGHSLLEVTIALSIIALAATFALQSYTESNERARIASAASSFASFLRQARQRAAADHDACGYYVLLEDRSPILGRFAMYRIDRDPAGTCAGSRVDLQPPVTQAVAVLDEARPLPSEEWTVVDPPGQANRFAAFDRRGASRGAALDPAGTPPSRGARFAFRSRRMPAAARLVEIDAGSGEVGAR